jgi:hypothetical protein
MSLFAQSDDKCVVIDLSHSDGLNERTLIYLWSLGDGAKQKGLIVEHCYEKYGTYTVKLDVIDSATGLFIKNELTTSLTLDPPGLNGKDIIDVFNEKEKSLPFSGRYTEDGVHLLIVDKDNQNNQHLFLMSEQDYAFALPPGHTYRVLLYKGNMFFSMKEILFLSEDSQDDINSKLISLIKSTLLEPLLSLAPLEFQKDQSNISSNDLLASLELLQANLLLKIELGVYTHTGGRIDRNINLSMQRSDFIKQYCIKKGIHENRIRQSTPSVNSHLLNTCFEKGTCAYEDERLNRKAFMKIVGLQSN